MRRKIAFFLTTLTVFSQVSMSAGKIITSQPV